MEFEPCSFRWRKRRVKRLKKAQLNASTSTLPFSVQPFPQSAAHVTRTIWQSCALRLPASTSPACPRPQLSLNVYMLFFSHRYYDNDRININNNRSLFSFPIINIRHIDFATLCWLFMSALKALIWLSTVIAIRNRQIAPAVSTLRKHIIHLQCSLSCCEVSSFVC